MFQDPRSATHHLQIQIWQLVHHHKTLIFIGPSDPLCMSQMTVLSFSLHAATGSSFQFACNEQLNGTFKALLSTQRYQRT